MEETTPKKRVVSYSQYSMWANCPKQWKLAYVDKLKPDEASIHLVFGKAIHEAIQQWLDILYNGEKFKSKVFDIEEVFKEKLLHFFKEDIRTTETGQKIYPCDQAILKEFYLDGCEILKHVKKYQNDIFPTKGYELLGCEIPLEMLVSPGVNFIGYIDVVVMHRKSNKIYIYDLKTSTKGWYYEKKDPKKINQILLYKHFYSTQFDVPLENIEVQFTILKRKLNEANQWDTKRISNFQPANGTAAVNKAVKSFEEFVDIFNETGEPKLDVLLPTPSKQACRFCPFNNDSTKCSNSFYLNE